MIDNDALERELGVLGHALKALARGFGHLSPNATSEDWDSIQRAVLAASERMHDNYPYAHPLYAGQMLKPPHPVARIAYQMAMWINPNNHALDGGRASSAMEKEVVADLARVFDWEHHLGHLTSSGTLANLEALWIGARERENSTVVASQDAHYTHQRLCSVLGIDFDAIAVDPDGRMNLDALRRRLAKGDVGTVVATMGTTGFGAVDPLQAIVDLAGEHGVRVHADAAYGGYFRLCDTLTARTKNDFRALASVDSIAIDPHKHGLQPYGCGCVLFAEPAVGRHYVHDSPYTYFSSDELHLGEISLECSRAGAAAVGLWATHQALPPAPDGAFAHSLADCREAARLLAQHIAADPQSELVCDPQLDIVVWTLLPNEHHTASELARRAFDAAATLDLHLAVIDVAIDRVPEACRDGESDAVTCLRSCLMKPEHKAAMPEIISRLSRSIALARAG